MKWLELVAKDHKEYVKVVQNFGEYFYAEDIVQEAYIRIYNIANLKTLYKMEKLIKGLCILFCVIYI